MQLIFPILAFAAAALLSWLFSRPGSRLYILDYPNDRSLHTEPMPRTGGIAIFAAVYLCGLGLLVWSKAVPSEVFWLSGAGFIVAIVSFLDDRFSVPALYRMIVHFIAAGGLVYGGLGLEAFQLPGVTWNLDYTAGFILTLLIVVWLVNLYNFMDGMDGFAGSMALIGFTTYAWLGWIAGNELFASISAIIAASTAGFLLFNFPPAKIFMGDTGSSFLGFFAGALTIWASKNDIFPFWLGILIFSPFIFDATVTLIRRLIKREKVWHAHRSHYYQRLVRIGWGHKKTLYFEYFFMIGCSLTAILVWKSDDRIQWLAIIIWSILYLGLTWLVNLLEYRYRKTV